MDPKQLRYSKEHEWVAVDGGKATVGITDFAQSELGDIVFVELPEVGREISAGEVVGTIESVKAVSEIYAPTGGKVTEINDALDAAPDKVNADPLGEGWMYRVELKDPSELESLMKLDAYEEMISKG